MKLTSHILQGPFDLALRAATRRFVKRHHILIACMPKSGSTYLSNAISRLPRFRKTSLVTHYGRTEQDLDLRLALRKSRHNYVCQHHVRYNEKTSDVINRFGVTPIVLVRNVFDCVPSIRDHLRNEAVESPTAYFSNTHPQMSDNKSGAHDRSACYPLVHSVLRLMETVRGCSLGHLRRSSTKPRGHVAPHSEIDWSTSRFKDD